ncbi:lysophospholipid acyltransferase family protein [Paenisporosarcina sp.]|uniref:lysophospholipid acyltransferase family protein n=1 Tax=Paenisporosarcina sp. TaxID=1932001 RepID=UPI003C72C417
MYNSLRTFSFLFGYLPFSLKGLREVQTLKGKIPIKDYDELVHQQPKRWAQGILRRTKSTFKVEGLELIPEETVLFVSNHEGNFDIPSLIAHIPKPFAFMSKVEVKKLPIIIDWMVAMNCVFIDRTNRRSSMRSITDMVSTLKAGHSMIIFPEGTRSKGTEVQEFKSGFVRIAKEAKIPIVPIAIAGTSDILENNQNKIKPAHVFITVLPTISIDTIQELSSRELIAHVQQKIAVEVKHLQQTKNQMPHL